MSRPTSRSPPKARRLPPGLPPPSSSCEGSGARGPCWSQTHTSCCFFTGLACARCSGQRRAPPLHRLCLSGAGPAARQPTPSKPPSGPSARGSVRTSAKRGGYGWNGREKRRIGTDEDGPSGCAGEGGREGGQEDGRREGETRKGEGPGRRRQEHPADVRGTACPAGPARSPPRSSAVCNAVIHHPCQGPNPAQWKTSGRPAHSACPRQAPGRVVWGEDALQGPCSRLRGRPRGHGGPCAPQGLAFCGRRKISSREGQVVSLGKQPTFTEFCFQEKRSLVIYSGPSPRTPSRWQQ